MTSAAARPATSAARTGRAGLAATAVSIICTIAVAAAGPSLMEPPLPGARRQPPWAFDLGLNPYLAVGLAAAGLAAGTLGVALTLRAMRRGWTVSPRYVLIAGALAAAVAGTTRPFGSSDFISYAAYGRELVTGHNPYLVSPAALARLGDPVAQAVQDWAGTPSVYGAFASGVFGVASLIGGTSVRLTVFVLDMANVAAFIGTGVLLDRMARGPAGRLRAAVLWTCNPLLLQILVAGSHVDGLAAAFSIAGIAVLAPRIPNGRFISSPPDSEPPGTVRPPRGALRGLAAGLLLGMGFAVKPTVLLVALGLGVAARPRNGFRMPLRTTTPASSASLTPPASRASPTWPPPTSRPPVARGLIANSGAIAPQIAIKWSAVLGLAAGFAAVAGADILLLGRAGITQALRASGMVSVGSPWRVVRTLLSLLVSSSVADEVVRWCAVALAVFLAIRLLHLLRPGAYGSLPLAPSTYLSCWHKPAGSRQANGAIGMVRPGACAGFALVFAWLLAWPYVLPWYDAIAWALLPLLPASGLDWLLLARTAVLGFGYLPARSAGITIPGGLRWTEPVLRSAVTPAVLTFLLVIVVLRTTGGPIPPTERDGYSAHRDSHRDLYRRSGSRGDRRRDRAGRTPADRPRRA